MVFLQLLCHLWGDFPLQSSWMADNKVKSWRVVIIHACVYFVPFFIVFRPSPAAALVIIGTHALIDRFRLAKHISFASQYLAPPSAWRTWAECRANCGYKKEVPPFMAVWLMIIVDATTHLTINYFALTHL